jgi:formylglycine-generating enzyme required for sulfatase activity
VKNEASIGLERGVLVPVLIGEVRPPIAFRHIHSASLIEWDGSSRHDAYIRLEADLSRLISAAPARRLRGRSPVTYLDAHPSVATIDALMATEHPPARSGDTGDILVEPVTGIRFLVVPAGSFRMGAKDLSYASPEHEVMLSRFWLAETPVTNSQYSKFTAATGHAAHEYAGDPTLGGPNQPVVGVSWSDATMFSAWLSKETGFDVRLPTEAEWERAARGNDGRRYPWGNDDPDETRARYGLTYQAGTADAGSYPAGKGPFGHLDLAGNVSEWCRDVWNVKAYDRARLRAAVIDPEVDRGDLRKRVLRGGGFARDAASLRSACRVGSNFDGRYWDLGFRVASYRRRPFS